MFTKTLRLSSILCALTLVGAVTLPDVSLAAESKAKPAKRSFKRWAGHKWNQLGTAKRYLQDRASKLDSKVGLGEFIKPPKVPVKAMSRSEYDTYRDAKAAKVAARIAGRSEAAETRVNQRAADQDERLKLPDTYLDQRAKVKHHRNHLSKTADLVKEPPGRKRLAYAAEGLVKGTVAGGALATVIGTGGLLAGGGMAAVNTAWMSVAGGSILGAGGGSLLAGAVGYPVAAVLATAFAPAAIIGGALALGWVAVKSYGNRKKAWAADNAGLIEAAMAGATDLHDSPRGDTNKYKALKKAEEARTKTAEVPAEVQKALNQLKEQSGGKYRGPVEDLIAANQTEMKAQTDRMQAVLDGFQKESAAARTSMKKDQEAFAKQNEALLEAQRNSPTARTLADLDARAKKLGGNFGKAANLVAEEAVRGTPFAGGPTTTPPPPPPPGD